MTDTLTRITPDITPDVAPLTPLEINVGIAANALRTATCKPATGACALMGGQRCAVGVVAEAFGWVPEFRPDEDAYASINEDDAYMIVSDKLQGLFGSLTASAMIYQWNDGLNRENIEYSYSEIADKLERALQ